MATAITTAARLLEWSEAEVYDVLVDVAECVDEIHEFSVNEILDMVQN
jgi:hypothetical protein